MCHNHCPPEMFLKKYCYNKIIGTLVQTSTKLKGIGHSLSAGNQAEKGSPDRNV